jgi:hypothetical protein
VHSLVGPRSTKNSETPVKINFNVLLLLQKREPRPLPTDEKILVTPPAKLKIGDLKNEFHPFPTIAISNTNGTATNDTNTNNNANADTNAVINCDVDTCRAAIAGQSKRDNYVIAR